MMSSSTTTVAFAVCASLLLGCSQPTPSEADAGIEGTVLVMYEAIGTNLASDAENLYWGSGRDIRRLSLSAHSVLNAVTAQGAIRNVVSAGARLYWVRSDDDTGQSVIEYVAEDGGGGGIQEVRRVRTGHDVPALVVRDSYVYWVERAAFSDSSYRLFRHAGTSGTEPTLIAAEVVNGLAVCDGIVFWGNGDFVRRWPSETGEPEIFTAGFRESLVLGCDDVFLYWAFSPDNTTWSMRRITFLDGVEQLELATDIEQIGAEVAIDPDGLYITEGPAGNDLVTVSRIPGDGGAREEVVTITEGTLIERLTTHGNYVYYATYSPALLVQIPK